MIQLTEEEISTLGLHSERYTTSDDFIRISVRDYGDGIPDERLPRIFEKDVTFKRSGSGIGLALTEVTAGLLNGFVKVETTVGEGSTFSLYLPKEIKTAD